MIQGMNTLMKAWQLLWTEECEDHSYVAGCIMQNYHVRRSCDKNTQKAPHIPLKGSSSGIIWLSTAIQKL